MRAPYPTQFIYHGNVAVRSDRSVPMDSGGELHWNHMPTCMIMIKCSGKEAQSTEQCLLTIINYPSVRIQNVRPMKKE